MTRRGDGPSEGGLTEAEARILLVALGVSLTPQFFIDEPPPDVERRLIVEAEAHLREWKECVREFKTLLDTAVSTTNTGEASRWLSALGDPRTITEAAVRDLFAATRAAQAAAAARGDKNLAAALDAVANAIEPGAARTLAGRVAAHMKRACWEARAHGPNPASSTPPPSVLSPTIRSVTLGEDHNQCATIDGRPFWSFDKGHPKAIKTRVAAPNRIWSALVALAKGERIELSASDVRKANQWLASSGVKRVRVAWPAQTAKSAKRAVITLQDPDVRLLLASGFDP